MKVKFRKFPNIMILLILLFSFFPQNDVKAANIVVDTDIDNITANGGICTAMQISDLPGPEGLTTLREAICAANGTPGADTISFAGNYTITLNNLQLPSIKTEITINGNGINNTILQASTCNPVTLPGNCTPASTRVFEIDWGTLILNNLTVRHGNPSGDGGGILNTIGQLAIYSSSISGNKADNGGGISNDDHIADISDSIFSGNSTAGGGGGIYNNNHLIDSIDNTSFTGNQAGTSGGAIHLRSWSSPPITNSTFSDNSAGVHGGAVYFYDDFNTISGCTFSNNSAGFHGGAVFFYHFFGSLTKGTIENSTFEDNSAVENGGAIRFKGGITGITHTTFNRNTAKYGGAVCNDRAIQSPLLLETLSHSTFASNHAIEGGAIYNDNPITNISNSTFSGNSAKDYAGGIYNLNTINAITNTTFYGNYGEDFGGGIFNSGTINTINSTIVVNSPAGGNCQGTPPDGGAYNLTDFRDCWSWDDSLNYNLHLDPLSDNGGPTQTHALVFTSPANPAINTGPATCSSPPVNNQDQRSVTRSLYGNCDIGAYEYSGDNIELVVLTSNPADGAQVQNVPHINVSFNKNVVHDGGSNAVNNPDNYLLVEEGQNKIFDTQSCLNGLQGDDTQIPINIIAYNTTSHIAALTPNPSPLRSGDYRLFVCGTTSIFDLVGLELNYGLSDTLIDITVLPAINNLPKTGFAPGSISAISEQPEQKAYTLHSEMWLEIPRISLEANIVGVPIVEGNWDVTWLGNNAGYLTGTAFPTWEGNTVLTGHVWNAWNEPGPFSNIKTLQFGDQFYIHAYGRVFTYEVQKNFRIYSNSQNALSHSDFDTVTLLTCEGWNKWTGEYQYRRAVKAVLVNIQPE